MRTYSATVKPHEDVTASGSSAGALESLGFKSNVLERVGKDLPNNEWYLLATQVPCDHLLTKPASLFLEYSYLTAKRCDVLPNLSARNIELASSFNESCGRCQSRGNGQSCAFEKNTNKLTVIVTGIVDCVFGAGMPELIGSSSSRSEASPSQRTNWHRIDRCH